MWSCLVVLLCLSASCLGQGTVQFVDNGYTDVIVSISPDVPADQGQQIVDGIKSWIQQGSTNLYSATKQLSYINHVKILIPDSWTDITDAQPSNDIAYEDGVIRVDVMNPLFGDAPNTIQTGGCGERGEYIHITPDFIADVDGLSAGLFGPPGHTFVHTWAKLRYGVFEEYGYPGDEIFPLFYLESEITPSGYVYNEVPNFCTDVEIEGHKEDLVSGATCTYSEETGLPDGNCIFIPDGDNSAISSSYMAAPFLESTNRFCEDGEYNRHNKYLPTKHNALCNLRSTWDVVSSNEDFDGVTALPDAEAPPTTFEILRPQLGQFVMVIDRSGSMTDQPQGERRLDRLKQSAQRWLQLDVQDGSFVGITSFSSDYSTAVETQVDAQMTLIDEVTRNELVSALFAIEALGGTCLGEGLRQGLETLQTTSPTGGVMLFMTDGNFDCQGGTPLSDPTLQQEIIDSGVRIVTIAFSNDADEDLEVLARISNGKTYFIPDGAGVEDINDAFEGTLTYQPSVSTEELDIVIASGSRKEYMPEPSEKTGTFIIDATIGKDVKIQIDHDFGDSIEKLLLFADGAETEHINNSTMLGFFLAQLGDMEPGTYEFFIVSSKELKFADYMVTSKALEDTVPIHTRCYVNSGSDEIDLQGQPLSILAQVTQGSRPVMNAIVQAQIEKEGEANAITLELFDNGSAADLIANDGIYSRYFAGFDTDGRYTLKCQISGDDSTEINGGFTNAKKLLGFRQGDPVVAGPPVCCGSNTVNENTIKVSTGVFERPAVGGSIKIKNPPVAGTDIYPPEKVKDLKATPNRNNNAIVLSFTSPGDDYDEGIVESYEIRYSFDQISLLDNFEDATELKAADLVLGYDLTPVEGKQTKEVALAVDFDEEQTYFFAMRSADDAGQQTSISNLASATTAEPPKVDTSTQPSTTNPTTQKGSGSIAREASFVVTVMALVVLAMY